jgi:hypothetical protein
MSSAYESVAGMISNKSNPSDRRSDYQGLITRGWLTLVRRKAFTTLPHIIEKDSRFSTIPFKARSERVARAAAAWARQHTARNLDDF